MDEANGYIQHTKGGDVTKKQFKIPIPKSQIFTTIIKLFKTITSLNNLTSRKQNEYAIYIFYLLNIPVYFIGHKGSNMFNFFLIKPTSHLCGNFNNYWKVPPSHMELFFIELDINISQLQNHSRNWTTQNIDSHLDPSHNLRFPIHNVFKKIN